MTKTTRHSAWRTLLKAGFLSLALGALLLRSAAGADDAAITSVSSAAWKGYVRTRLPDHSFKPETYTLGEGGTWDGIKSGGIKLDDASFLKIARMIAEPLKSQNYLPINDPNKTNLLIVVYWGVTMLGGVPQDPGKAAVNKNQTDADQLATLQSTHSDLPSDADDQFRELRTSVQMSQQERDRANFVDGQVLGFTDDLERAKAVPYVHSSSEIEDEVEEGRYFVVLQAFDFQTAWKKKNKKLLWQTRFSITMKRNDFFGQLPNMAKYASQFFGGNTEGVVHDRAIPAGRVEVGVPKVVDDKSAK